MAPLIVMVHDAFLPSPTQNIKYKITNTLGRENGRARQNKGDHDILHPKWLRGGYCHPTPLNHVGAWRAWVMNSFGQKTREGSQHKNHTTLIVLLNIARSRSARTRTQFLWSPHCIPTMAEAHLSLGMHMTFLVSEY